MLRDRRSLAVMFGIPLVLYPLVAIGISSLGAEEVRSRRSAPAQVAVTGADAAPSSSSC